MLRNGLVWLFLAGLATAQIQLPVGLGLIARHNVGYMGMATAPVAIDFSADGAVLFMGVNGNLVNSAIFAAPVFRDPTNQRIVGFGQGTFTALAPYLDASIETGPNGNRFVSQFPVISFGQYVGTNFIQHALPAFVGTTGGLTFVPPGLPNAGTMLISSFSGNVVYAVGLAPGSGGDLVPTTTTPFATLPVNYLEGMRFIPSGPYAGDLLVCDFGSSGTIWRVDIDPATGLPFGGAANTVVTPFVGNFFSQDGLALDPITGDMFVTDWNDYFITHFTSLDTLDPLVASDDSLSASGQTLVFNWRCGTGHGYKSYLLAMGASGSAPGVTVGSLSVPLNPDAITNLALSLIDSPPFFGFEFFLSQMGEGASVLALPPGVLPQSAAGIQLTFAGILTDNLDFATNAVDIVITP